MSRDDMYYRNNIGEYANSECEHEKVYADYVLTSNPPLHPWICRKCMEEGHDRGFYQNQSMEYNYLLRKKVEMHKREFLYKGENL